MKLLITVFFFLFLMNGISQDNSINKFTFDIEINDTGFVFNSCIPDSLYKSNFIRPNSENNQNTRRAVPSNPIFLNGCSWLDGCLIYRDNYDFNELEIKTLITQITTLSLEQIIINTK